MSATTLRLTVEPGVLDERSCWSVFDSLAVEMSRDICTASESNTDQHDRSSSTPGSTVSLRVVADIGTELLTRPWITSPAVLQDQDLSSTE